MPINGKGIILYEVGEVNNEVQAPEMDAVGRVDPSRIGRIPNMNIEDVTDRNEKKS